MGGGRSRSGLMMAATAAVLVVTGITSAVNPRGGYSMTGLWAWSNGTFQFDGDHSGTFTLKKFAFNGNAVEDDSYRTQYALALSPKVAGTGQSTRALSGQILRTLPGVHQTLYTLTRGTANFKVTSNGSVVYNASISAVGTSGFHAGSGYGVTLKGKKDS